MKKCSVVVRLFLLMTVLTGIIYPLIVTAFAYALRKDKAEGDFITSHGKIIGARLIAQKFESPRYFWPRPSAVDYNPLPSGASNLGPTSAALKTAVEDRKLAILKAHETDIPFIPGELLFASGSGLDPHISPETAYFQVDRILKARGLTGDIDKKAVEAVIETHKQKRILGVFGEEYVNVLIMNKELDEIKPTPKPTYKKTPKPASKTK